MNYLVCTECGRSTYVRDPAQVAELRSGYVLLHCVCRSPWDLVWRESPPTRAEVDKWRRSAGRDEFRAMECSASRECASQAQGAL